ncbi:hypothetical protein SZ64_08465 [Erythrobacter sp. SG61-1L]|uniref:hypothetical protein n=1 Tax=Erythrobacter sp. SG61-1L TaxID=1603897 RepID=UPI0006C937AB|nr:hypothetical protein [Erythrobacter sp. SG61-1L]KPL68150.1 hypothetical protein SZ64_08465 [Erythrobacter sp. SG61-1L]
MTSRRYALPFFAAASLALAGCAKDDGAFPSLAIRDAERVSGVFQPVEAETFIPAPQGPETLGRIDRLRADAESAHARFLTAAGKARTSTSAARSAGIGDEQWSVAQVALGDLTGIRSETMISLAELDLLYVNAQTDGQELAQIESARADVEKLVGEEDRLLDSLNAQLAN